MPGPEAIYRQRCAEFGARRDHYQRLSQRQGNLNLLLAAAAAACLVGAGWRGDLPLYLAAGALFVALLAALTYHQRINVHLGRYSTLFAMNDEGIQRLARAWSYLPLPGSPSPSPAAAALDNNTSDDLDLLGHASLEHLLSTPATPVGQTALRDWILMPAAVSVIAERQAAVAELAPQIDFRDEIGLQGRLMGPKQAGYERFVAWAEGEGWLRRRRWLLWWARLAPLCLLGLAIALAAGFQVGLPLAAILLVNLGVTYLLGPQINQQIEQVAERQAVFHAYAGLFDLISGQAIAAASYQQLQARLAAGGAQAGAQMRRLSRLMPLADIRRWMLFFIIEVPTLWSVHLLWLLERWQRVSGAHVREWLAVVGETEALIALAALKHDHPAWAFPELSAGEPARLSATHLAHPLLPPARAVGNDVEVGPPGTFLLVTGSNMSGKSTLLRAIGVNVVLAQMGGPVCADAMCLPPLTVASSMRVQDSLAGGISTFMAELRRLKEIVDLTDRPADRPVLYLLDEILQGTNTAERQIAARRIILHLVAGRAIGAVSTHDLTLADAPEMAQVSVPVHFTEQFVDGLDGQSMTFDYRLRPGIATSTNALKLMELIGLPLK